MASLHLYDALPQPLQHLATAAMGARFQRQRTAGVYRTTRRFLAESERWPASRLREFQSERLQALVRHAVSRTWWYRKLFDEQGISPETIRTSDELRRLPLLEKTTLLDNVEQVQASGVGHVHQYFTSGTTGTTLAIPIDDASRQRNYAFFARARAWAGVETGRSATFAGRTVVPSRLTRPRCVWRWNPAMRNRLFSSYHLSAANATAYSQALCTFAPDWIDSYPSSIASLAALLRDAGLPAPRPRAIITSSETLQGSQRALVEDTFCAQCFDQYGCTEQAAYVSQCERGSYHVHPEYGIVEVLRSDGEPAKPGEMGEVVCTSFTNDALPLLRYRIGDLAVPGEAECGCGRAFPVLQEIVGRSDDVLTTPDGRRVGRLDPVFKGRRSIREAQIVQEETDQVTVRVVADTAYTDADGESIVHELRARLGPLVRITIVREPRLERTASGKLRAVINRCSERTSNGRGRP